MDLSLEFPDRYQPHNASFLKAASETICSIEGLWENLYKNDNYMPILSQRSLCHSRLIFSVRFLFCFLRNVIQVYGNGEIGW